MKKFISAIFITVLILSGCVKLARYDNETYKELTFTKVNVQELYDQKGQMDEVEWQIEAESILLHLKGMLEYEANKKKNEDTTKQLRLLKEIYESHIDDDEWDDLERELYTQTILLSFDGMIDSEKAKNKELF
jgi:hypothetical protein